MIRFNQLILISILRSAPTTKQEGALAILNCAGKAVEVAAEEKYIKPEDISRLIKFQKNPNDESWING